MFLARDHVLLDRRDLHPALHDHLRGGGPSCGGGGGGGASAAALAVLDDDLPAAVLGRDHHSVGRGRRRRRGRVLEQE